MHWEISCEVSDTFAPVLKWRWRHNDCIFVRGKGRSLSGKSESWCVLYFSHIITFAYSFGGCQYFWNLPGSYLLTNASFFDELSSVHVESVVCSTRVQSLLATNKIQNESQISQATSHYVQDSSTTVPLTWIEHFPTLYYIYLIIPVKHNSPPVLSGHELGGWIL